MAKKTLVLGLSWLVCSCNLLTADAKHEGGQQGLEIQPLGWLSLLNQTPVYGFSAAAGKLVSWGTLGSHIDPEERGEQTSTVPIWGYTEFSSAPRGQPNGWWQLGEEPPFFYAKMSGLARDHVTNGHAGDEPLFPQQTARACPLLRLDPTGRLVPIDQTTPGQPIGVYGLEGDYAQLSRKQAVYLGRHCTNLSAEFDDILKGVDEQASGNCYDRVLRALNEAKASNFPYVVFCFGNGFDQAVSYYGGDQQDFMKLRDWQGALEIGVYNVSHSENANVSYMPRGTQVGWSHAAIMAQQRASLAVGNRAIDADIFITTTSGPPHRAFRIPVNALPKR